MKTFHGAALGLVLLFGAAANSQQSNESFASLPEAPQARVQTMLDSLNSPLGALPAPASTAAESSSTDAANTFAITTVRTRVIRSPRVVDARFLLINGLHLGLAFADTEMTQKCIADHRCREGNPLMPSSHMGQIAVDLGFVAYASGVSYWFKKHRSTLWWLPPTGGVAAHTFGLATGLLHN